MKGDHIESEASLKRSELIELVKYLLREGVFFQFDNDSDILFIGFVSDIAYSYDHLIPYQVSDLDYEIRFIQLVRYFSDDYHSLTILQFIYGRFSSQYNASSSCCVCIQYVFFIIDDSTRREIRSLDEIHKILNCDFGWIGMSDDIEDCIY